MELVVERLESAAVVTVSGDVDAASAHLLREAFDELVANGEHRFVIDLAGVAFMDSSGLASLVQLFKRVRIGEGDVRICALQPAVLRIFELVRLTRVFELFDTAEDAYASYSESDIRATS
jgi:anti-sigma B factor antagonist